LSTNGASGDAGFGWVRPEDFGDGRVGELHKSCD
jgi:hypothetical protein